MRRLASGALAVLSSLRLSVALLVLLGLLTWLGTLEQVEHGLHSVQAKYFESFVLTHDFGPVALPLPGANLVLSVLFVNLLVGGIARLRRGRATLGILIVHLGIALMLVAAFVKHRFADEGHVTLFEGQSAAEFQSYYRLELAVTEHSPAGPRVHVVPEERFREARDGRVVELASADLPFRLRLDGLLEHCEPRPAARSAQGARVVDGFALVAFEREKEAERNIAGAHVLALDLCGAVCGEGLLWGAEAAPWRLTVAGRDFDVALRKERQPLPFRITLDDFEKQDHPRTGMPRSFASTVQIDDGVGQRAVRISMNEPLRKAGLVVYQASWGPSAAPPGARLFSTLAVVRNPADSWPLVACLVIAAGLALHFGRRLAAHVRTQMS